MAIDRFFSMSNSIAGPATSGETITPNDAADIGFVTRGLWVGGAGNISVVMMDGQTVTLNNVAAGTLLSVRVNRVRATGTTATGIVGLS